METPILTLRKYINIIEDFKKRVHNEMILNIRRGITPSTNSQRVITECENKIQEYKNAITTLHLYTYKNGQ